MRKKRKVLIWSCLALLVVGGYFLWHFFQRKGVGRIHVRNADSLEYFDKKSEKRLYKGKFLEFFHEAAYVEKSHSTPEGGPIVETVFLSTKDVEGRKIAITVVYRGTTDLTSDPSFQLRQASPQEYHSKNFKEGAWQGVLFEKKSAPFERTIFLEKNGYIISISLTSPFSSDGLEEEVLTIVRELSFSPR